MIEKSRDRSINGCDSRIVFLRSMLIFDVPEPVRHRGQFRVELLELRAPDLMRSVQLADDQFTVGKADDLSRMDSQAFLDPSANR